MALRPPRLAEQQMKKSTTYLLLAGMLFVVYVSVNVATLDRYGITYDEPEHWEFGDRYLEFYLTLDPKFLDFTSSGWKPTATWPVGPTLAAATAKLFCDWLGLVDRNDGHHLASILLMGLLLSTLFLFLAVHAGVATAILSVLALALQPRVWGDAHNNSQDIPHLVFYTMTILAFLHGMLRRRAVWILVSAVFWGLALGSKINAISVPMVIAPILLSWLWAPREQPASARWSLLAYPFLALGVLLLVWPYFWQHPLDRLLEFRSNLIRWGYAGPLIWQVAPIRDVLVTTPVPTVIFALTGVLTSVWRGSPLGRPAISALLLWLVVPIARSSLPGVLNYDVIRRFMEYVPALAIFAGIGGAALIEWTSRSGWLSRHRVSWAVRAAVLGGFLWPIVAIWQYFPYEGAYYNVLVGGLRGAQSRAFKHSTDYGVSAYREGIDWINRHADPNSFLIVHLPSPVPYYRLRKDITWSTHLWMDQLVSEGRAVYLMYVTREPYDYNICVAEAFHRPEHEIRRDGGTLLRIFKLTPESRPVVSRNVLPVPQQFSVTQHRRNALLTWEPAPGANIVAHILYYGVAPGHYQGSVCHRERSNRWEVFAAVPFGTYYLSLSYLTTQAQESQRTPDIRKDFLP